MRSSCWISPEWIECFSPTRRRTLWRLPTLSIRRITSPSVMDLSEPPPGLRPASPASGEAKSFIGHGFIQAPTRPSAGLPSKWGGEVIHSSWVYPSPHPAFGRPPQQVGRRNRPMPSPHPAFGRHPQRLGGEELIHQVCGLG